MCGIVGIAGKSDVNTVLYDALTVLQHRGQDSAGIVTYGDGVGFSPHIEETFQREM
jgi:amidophosphoribosyltransferase